MGFVNNVLAPTLLWWLATTAIGLAAVPLVLRLFPSLPDRGLAFCRPLGLLAMGYLYWLGVMAGVVPNSQAGVIALAAVWLGVGWWLAGRDRAAVVDALRARRRLLTGYEVLFAVALLVWAIYRAYTPNIEVSGGEKYMEMAFIKSILVSPRFPPLDPWLSGYAISYYYFGYVIAGMLAQMTGILPSIAFNLVIPMTWGMTLVGAFGLGYNLVAMSAGATRQLRVVGGAATAVLLGVIGSLEGALELAYMQGWGSAAFFKWLDIRDLVPGGNCGETNTSTFGAGGWLPSRFIWWWRGSRVIHDNCGEIIHEFPFFSFMLADVHPHVVGLPYVLMALGLALAMLAGGFAEDGEERFWSPRWLALPWIVGALGFINTWDLPAYGFVLVVAYGFYCWTRPAWVPRLTTATRLCAGLAVAGSLAVGWRLASMVLERTTGLAVEAQPLFSRLALTSAVAAAVIAVMYYLWGRAQAGDRTARRLLDIGRFGVWLVGLSIVLYAPFYVGFSSQASGLGFVEHRTRLAQFLVHFGFVLFMGLSTIVALAAGLRGRWRLTGGSLVLLAFAVPFAIVAIFAAAWTALVLSLVLAAAGVVAMELWPVRAEMGVEAGDGVDRELPETEVSSLELPEAEESNPELSETKVSNPELPEPKVSNPTLSNPDLPNAGSMAVAPPSPWQVAPVFALVCVAVGVLLPLGTEFVFIRDIFGARMNTIFKLYYQAWTLLAVGGGYAVYAVSAHWARWAAWLWAVPAVLLLAGSMYYPIASVYTRTNGFNVGELTLDGLHYWQDQNPDDVAAAKWLEANVTDPTVVLQATGGGYQPNYRLAMATGLPTVLGSDLHEWQWRGNRLLVDPRVEDVKKIYETTDTAEMLRLLDKYHVRYVVVGQMERDLYSITDADIKRLKRVLNPVFDIGKVIIFER